MSVSKIAFCRSVVEPVKMRLEWLIENFALVKEISQPSEMLLSQSVTHSVYPGVFWKMKLFPAGEAEENAKSVSWYLNVHTNPCADLSLNAKFNFYFVQDNGEKKQFGEPCFRRFECKDGDSEGDSWGFTLEDDEDDEFSRCIRSDGSLFIQCEFEVLPNLNEVACVSITSIETSVSPVTTQDKFTLDMNSLLETGLMSDFQINVGSASFAVHKNILAARSEVFRAMFDSELTEAASGCLTITDFSSEALHEMLHYIYTGKQPLLDDHASDLLGLADKYALLQLKTSCENVLCNIVSLENVCQLVSVADLYRAQALKNSCIAYIAANKKRIMNSSGWSQLKKSKPSLVNEILEVIVGMSTMMPATSQGPQKKKLRKT